MSSLELALLCNPFSRQIERLGFAAVLQNEMSYHGAAVSEWLQTRSDFTLVLISSSGLTTSVTVPVDSIAATPCFSFSWTGCTSIVCGSPSAQRAVTQPVRGIGLQ
jgi:hypothetical protein